MGGDLISATNRGAERKPQDFYPTPDTAIKSLLNNIDLSKYGNRVLEPSAGSGNICKQMKQYYPEKNITAIEIRFEELKNLESYSNEVIITNFLQKDMNRKFDIIIGNPPFSDALEFVEKSLSLLSENGILIFLLRTSFLESKRRHEFWQKHPLSGLYTLSQRPSFTGKGTDASSYSWFIWDKSTDQQTIKVL